jgi:hypothetical protein
LVSIGIRGLPTGRETGTNPVPFGRGGRGIGNPPTGLGVIPAVGERSVFTSIFLSVIVGVSVFPPRVMFAPAFRVRIPVFPMVAVPDESTETEMFVPAVRPMIPALLHTWFWGVPELVMPSVSADTSPAFRRVEVDGVHESPDVELGSATIPRMPVLVIVLVVPFHARPVLAVMERTPLLEIVGLLADGTGAMEMPFPAVRPSSPVV